MKSLWALIMLVSLITLLLKWKGLEVLNRSLKASASEIAYRLIALILIPSLFNAQSVLLLKDNKSYGPLHSVSIWFSIAIIFLGGLLIIQLS